VQESTINTADREDRIELMGLVDETLPGTFFKVKCDNGCTVLCTLGGKLRLNQIRILVGDIVKIEVSPYDTTRGRVVYRSK
jgi:translation initiation factor IF-1